MHGGLSCTLHQPMHNSNTVLDMYPLPVLRLFQSSCSYTMLGTLGSNPRSPSAWVCLCTITQVVISLAVWTPQEYDLALTAVQPAVIVSHPSHRLDRQCYWGWFCPTITCWSYQLLLQNHNCFVPQGETHVYQKLLYWLYHQLAGLLLVDCCCMYHQVVLSRSNRW